MNDRTCSIAGCEKPARCRGWCQMHYRRWKTHGSTDDHLDPRRVLSHEERFWSRVDRTGSCWLWTGTLDHRGYGRYCNPVYGTHFAHRICWILLRGPLTPDVTLDHVAERCGNKNCVNPDHLDPVSLAENHRRWSSSLTHCRKGHRYSEEPFEGMRRRCPICRKASRRAATVRQAERRRSGTPIPPTVTHGKPSTYTGYGCRCDECRAANKEFYRAHPRRPQRRTGAV